MSIILTVLICVVIFLIIRKIVLWYFKFDVMAQYQKEILEQLKIMNGLPGKEDKPKTFMEGLKKGMAG